MKNDAFSISTAESSGNITPSTMLKLKVGLLTLIAHLHYT